VKRREFITLLGGAAATWPLAARAQQNDRMRRVGLLMGYPEGDRQARANVVAFREGLQSLGWIEGRNIELQFRWAGGDPDRARAFAKELVEMKLDVIVPSTNQVTEILQHQTRAIPIVFVFVGDPVGSGFVKSLSRPGGNITGFANFENSIGGKWLEVLKELAPKIRNVGFIHSPLAAPNIGFLRAAEAAGPSLGVKVFPLPVNNAADIERTVATFAAEPDGGLIVAPHAVTLGFRELIIGLAARRRLPAVFSDRYFAESGGLLSFGNNTANLFRESTTYIDRILKGAKPADLPVQLPTKFELIIHLKTAKALGLEVPWFLQQRADEVIE
jgi:putative tryptophan/tyrosine transport system substrate-binding protein